MITPGTSGAPGTGTQQQAIINAVARRQYGRWAAQYRAANLWAAVQRDTSPEPVAPPAATTPQRLAALRDLWASGVITDEEFEQFKAAVLAG